MVANLVELRGIAIWEPYVTILSDREVEMFSDVLGDYVCCTLAANKDFLRVNQDLFEEFLDSFDSGRKNVRKLAQLIEMDYRTVKKSISSYILDVEQRKEFAERELEFLRLGGVESILRI
jgi:predicted transcriptional regulator